MTATTFLEKLSLAFAPGELETFNALATQRAERSSTIITPNLLTILLSGSD